MSIRVGDVMTSRVVTLTPEMTLSEMDTVLMKKGVSGAPVVSRNQLVGVASQADIIRSLWEGQHEAAQDASYYSSPFPIPITALQYIARDARQLGDRLVEAKVGDIMTRDPLVTHPDDSIDDVAKRMVADQIHRLPVVEPGTGKLVGIISTLDLVRTMTIHGLATSPVD